MRASRAGIERRRAGKHQRPHHGRRLCDRDRVLLALADSQGGGDLVGDLHRVGLARHQRDAGRGGVLGSRSSSFLGREQMQRHAREVAVKPRQRRDQDHGQEKRDDCFLPPAHLEPRSRRLFHLVVDLVVHVGRCGQSVGDAVAVFIAFLSKAFCTVDHGRTMGIRTGPDDLRPRQGAGVLAMRLHLPDRRQRTGVLPCGAVSEPALHVRKRCCRC